MNMKKTEIRRLPHTKLVCGSFFLGFLKMAMSRKENAAGVIECNASKNFVNSLICDWFCVVSFYETGIFSSVHMDNAEADCFIAEKKKFTG